MLKDAKQFAEFVIQPRNWTNLVLFIGAVLVAVSDEDSKALSFSIGWMVAALIAFIPSLYSRSWQNCSAIYKKADRALAYCEGWKRCLAVFQAFNKSPEDEVSAESRRKTIDSDFESGLAYVESGEHMRIS